METTVTVVMVPPRELNPNNRENRWRKASGVKEYRHAARMAAVNALNTDGNGLKAFQGYYHVVHLDAEIQWRGRRKEIDNDNAIACLKPLIDGLSDALWEGRDGHVKIGAVTQSRGAGETVVTLRAVEDGA